MDIATIAGIILGLVAIIGSIFLLPGSNFGMFISVPSFFIDFGGSGVSKGTKFLEKSININNKSFWRVIFGKKMT